MFFFLPQKSVFAHGFSGIPGSNGNSVRGKSNNDRDSGKIKVQKYLENTIKNEVLANFSCPSLKESLM